MNEGTKNTVIGVVLAAVLAGMGTEIGLTINHGQHFAKIDQLLETQGGLLAEIKDSQDTVPAVVEHSLGEIRSRLNMLEYRAAQLDAKLPGK